MVDKENKGSYTEYPETGVKRWGEDVKNQAFMMYLHPAKPSMDSISQETGVPRDTIIYWRDSQGWVNKRSEMLTALAEQSYGEALAEIIRRKKQELADYDRISQVAMDAIADEDLYFKDKKQAIDAKIASSKAANEIKIEEEQKALIREIAIIIDEEVRDAQTRQAVGERLLQLEHSWGLR